MKMERISKKVLREFGIVFGLGFPFFIGWLIPLISNHPFKLWTLIFGVTSLILSVLKPTLLIYPYKFWMKLGFVLGWINSRIILGIIFIFVVQPIALIMKLSGYDPLNKNKNIYEKSFRENRKQSKIDLRRIF